MCILRENGGGSTIGGKRGALSIGRRDECRFYVRERDSRRGRGRGEWTGCKLGSGGRRRGGAQLDRLRGERKIERQSDSE